ncbi:MAG: DUF6502 family protein [Myxococcota bacterium]|nr:hypothetical protein [Myxococcales bacterium]
MSEPPTTPLVAPGSAALVRAARRMLRPLVRLLLEKQITLPYLTNVLKEIYVDVAARDLALEERRLTDSRISLLTGIHRKEVKRLRQEAGATGTRDRGVALGALLVSRWIGDPRFLDGRGRPRPLPRVPTRDEPTFDELVASVSKDIPVRSVLDEWLRLGVAEVDERDRVRLREDSFVPAHGLEEKIHFFGRNLGDHVAAGAHNILGEEPTFIDRSVFYDALTPGSIEELRKLAADEGAAALRRVNQRALELQTRDREAADARERMTFGAYFFAGQDEDASGDGGGDA